MSNIKDLEKIILIDISKAKSFQDLQIIKVRELGKKGKISLLMKSLSTVSNEEKKSLGKTYNELRLKVLDAFSFKEQDLKDIEIINKIKNENLDITLPIRPGNNDDEGKIHPISRTIDSIIDIFANFGKFKAKIQIIIFYQNFEHSASHITIIGTILPWKNLKIKSKF